MSDKPGLVEIYLHEYDKLKDEQVSRIGFRDNLIYVTLTLFGAIASFALSNPNNYFALLVLPWVCTILGWTYLVNDEKISAIGQFIRTDLADKIRVQLGTPADVSIFQWENEHRLDRRRKRRKINQLLVDETTFVLSGIASLMAFAYLVPHPSMAVETLKYAELIFLVVLGFEILLYADIQRSSIKRSVDLK